jgi:uncharacterized protein (TIGR03000 family)
MCHQRFALALMTALIAAGASRGQNTQSPGTLQPGTYNAPAGTGASAPNSLANPFVPTYAPGSAYRPYPSSRDILNRDILSPGRWNWLRTAEYPAKPGRENENTARIKVIVPTADAQIWVNDRPTKRQGLERDFISPPLRPGSYIYRFRISWRAGKAPVSEARTVRFQPGADLVIDVSKPQHP